MRTVTETRKADGAPYKKLLCECGRPARHRVIVPGLTSDLMVKRPTTLFLCEACYRLELETGVILRHVLIKDRETPPTPTAQ